MPTKKTIQLGEICKVLDVRERDARYVLEQGLVPKGVDQAPSTGNHRQFGPRQAFWLAMVLKLKSAGIRTPLAAEIANHADRRLCDLFGERWDWSLLKGSERLNSDDRRYVDVGDHRLMRFIPLDLLPGPPPRLENGWYPIGRGQHNDLPHPWVIIRLDVSKIARKLAAAFGP